MVNTSGVINEEHMSKIKDILRMVLTTRMPLTQIAASLAVTRNTVKRYRNAAAAARLAWDDISNLAPAELDAKFNRAKGRLIAKRMPDLSEVANELSKVGVTRQLLWEEYRLQGPDDALSYSQYAFHLREHQQKLNLSMRQTHVPGHAVFVDFSGKRPHYIDQQTGEIIHVELFVAVLGYSNLTYAAAVPRQKLPEWIQVNVQMLEYFEGVPLVVVPDNLRSAVTKSGREPLINRTYEDMARHYDLVVLPARARKPKDKPKVEGGVLIAQRMILAPLRNMKFFSLAELNKEIARLVEILNNRPFQKIPGCRRSRFEEMEREHMQALPAARYEFAEWSAPQTVHSDYHVRADGHWYSVPHHLVRQRVEVRLTASTVEIFQTGSRVASHARSHVAGDHTTDPSHQPPNHRAYAERTPEKFKAWAQTVGVSTAGVIHRLLDRKVPQMNMPACEGIQKLARQHGNEVVEAACLRALEIKSPTLKSVRSILNTGRLRTKQDEGLTDHNLPLHENLRGAAYFENSGATPC